MCNAVIKFNLEISQQTLNVSSNSANLPSVNSNNSTILSLLASSSAQSSSSSSATNITLSNFLTTTANAHNVNTAHTVNVTTGQRVIAKRIKMQNAARVLSGNQQVVTSPTNATVIAAAPSNPSVTTNINAQPVIRLSLSSLSNQVIILN